MLFHFAVLPKGWCYKYAQMRWSQWIAISGIENQNLEDQRWLRIIVLRSCRSPLRSDLLFNFLPDMNVVHSIKYIMFVWETRTHLTATLCFCPDEGFERVLSTLLETLPRLQQELWTSKQSTQIDRARIHEMMRDEGNIEENTWKLKTSLKTWKQWSHPDSGSDQPGPIKLAPGWDACYVGCELVQTCNYCLAGREQTFARSCTQDKHTWPNKFPRDK